MVEKSKQVIEVTLVIPQGAGLVDQTQLTPGDDLE
jgi:hypothetical protein